MSRVTLGDIWKVTAVDTEIYDEIKKIEVVPRKMVEMIIERCRVLVTAEDVQQYAEALLEQFEKNV